MPSDGDCPDSSEAAMSIPFNSELSFEYGKADRLSPLIRRVVAPNPSPFTFRGTGTYIVGNGQVAVIDPGPLDDAHVAALLEDVMGETVTNILITHTHQIGRATCRARECQSGSISVVDGSYTKKQNKYKKI